MDRDKLIAAIAPMAEEIRKTIKEAAPGTVIAVTENDITIMDHIKMPEFRRRHKYQVTRMQ